MNSHYTIPAGNSPAEYNENVQKTFREVFTTEKGAAVLNILLNDLYLFAPVNTDEARSLENYAKFFLSERLGIRDTIAITDALITDIE